MGDGTGGMDMRAAIFLYTTHCHDLFYRTIQFHENNPGGIQNREHCRGFNSESILARVVIPVCDTLS